MERRAKRLEFTRSAPAVPCSSQASNCVGQAAPGAPLLPERAWLVDAGLRLPLTTHLFLASTVFRRGEEDVLRRVNEDRLVNGVRVVASRFPTFASTTRRHVARRGPGGRAPRATGGRPAGSATPGHTRDITIRLTGESFDGDNDQRHTFNVFVQQRLSYRLKVSAKFRYGSNFPIVGYFDGDDDDLRLGSMRNTVRLPDYARLDLSGSRTFTFTRSRLTLFVEVMNVTGRENFGPADGAIRSNGAGSQLLREPDPVGALGGDTHRVLTGFGGAGGSGFSGSGSGSRVRRSWCGFWVRVLRPPNREPEPEPRTSEPPNLRIPCMITFARFPPVGYRFRAVATTSPLPVRTDSAKQRA